MLIEEDGVITNADYDLLANGKNPNRVRTALALLDLERDLVNRDVMARIRGRERGDELTTKALNNFDIRKAGE